jgi:glyoxylase-like metal-dependent hydrolase (beta-lactamase superfamily II)
MSNMPVRQIPGVYHRKIGDIIVTVISDGYIDGTLDLLLNVDLEVARKTLVSAFRPVRRISVNTFVIHSKGRTALIDTGAGNNFGAGAGWMNRNLAAAGVNTNDIETILLTHIHPDHTEGLTDTETGKAIFSNAELLLHEAELRHLDDDAAMARADDHGKKALFLSPRFQLSPYRKRIHTFVQGEVFPGVMAVPSLGHTPGHTAYLLADGDDQLMIWGDTVHLPEVQTAYPEAGVRFDLDSSLAVVSRRRMFDRVATEKILVAGMHLHFPAFSHLAKQSRGYRLYPEAWRHGLEL